MSKRLIIVRLFECFCCYRKSFGGDDTQFIDKTREYLSSVEQLIAQRSVVNKDYHSYYHYLQNRLRAKETNDERKIEKKIKLKHKSALITLCKYCGCRKSQPLVCKVKVDGKKKKIIKTKCNFCKHLSGFEDNESIT